MKRREFVTSVIAGGLAVPVLADEGHGKHRPMDGPLANATVSFGAWPSEPPFDRMHLPMGPPPPNIHQLIPHVATVKAGGSVNFIIAGFHNIAVYGPGTKPTDINTSLTAPVPGAPPAFPRIIDDPVNRVYRGPFDFNISQDRVEVVHFPERGLYLVICAFVPHFDDEMWGFVRVIR